MIDFYSPNQVGAVESGDRLQSNKVLSYCNHILNLMDTIKLRQVGNSVGTSFPQEYLKHMNVQAGDEIFISKEPGGKLLLSPYDPDFAATMEAYDRVEKRYRNALKELADR